MKRIVFATIFILANMSFSHAQDMIVTNVGKSMKVYNVEVGNKFVYYQKKKNENEEIKTMPKSEVLAIKKEDGTRIDPNATKEEMVLDKGLKLSDNPQDMNDPAVKEGFCPNSNHPHAIDLGIGVIFSCCNVGASAPWEFGGYYAWGETEEKNDYTWHTYIHCNGDYDCCHNIGIDIAGTKYDVAHVKWGGNWKMPNQRQAMLLISECAYQPVSLNGVLGGEYTGPNGNRIFLPAAGLHASNELYGSVYDTGNYWSSTQTTDNFYTYAYYMGFHRNETYKSITSRFVGGSVRPVTD